MWVNIKLSFIIEGSRCSNTTSLCFSPWFCTVTGTFNSAQTKCGHSRVSPAGLWGGLPAARDEPRRGSIPQLRGAGACARALREGGRPREGPQPITVRDTHLSCKDATEATGDFPGKFPASSGTEGTMSSVEPALFNVSTVGLPAGKAF